MEPNKETGKSNPISNQLLMMYCLHGEISVYNMRAHVRIHVFVSTYT